ncbi:carbonic anhydrase [Neobacillus sp. Marseille-QA0830]
MNIDENKKVLLVIGMEQSPERIMKEMSPLHPKHILVMQTYGPVIEPFGEIMRDIILGVYWENVEEIVVAVPNADRKNTREALKKIYANKELHEKIQTLDYLFKNCTPEYQNGSLREWLEGYEASANRRQNRAEVIRNHPLMPSHVVVTEIVLEDEVQSKTENLVQV